MQFTSAFFIGNETHGSVDLWVTLTGVLEGPTTVRYVDFCFVFVLLFVHIIVYGFEKTTWKKSYTSDFVIEDCMRVRRKSSV